MSHYITLPSSPSRRPSPPTRACSHAGAHGPRAAVLKAAAAAAVAVLLVGTLALTAHGDKLHAGQALQVFGSDGVASWAWRDGDRLTAAAAAEDQDGAWRGDNVGEDLQVGRMQVTSGDGDIVEMGLKLDAKVGAGVISKEGSTAGMTPSWDGGNDASGEVNGAPGLGDSAIRDPPSTTRTEGQSGRLVDGDVTARPGISKSAMKAEGSIGTGLEPCSDAVVAAVSRPSFWIVRETAPQSYTISPRSSRPISFPAHCLTSAVFSARLVNSAGTSRSSLGNSGTTTSSSETIVALPRPRYAVNSVATYALSLPSPLAAPRAAYQLEIRLEFGYLPGAPDAQICGNGTMGCDPLKAGSILGKEVKFGGGLVGFETVAGKTAQVVTAGSALISNSHLAVSAPLCTALSPLDGYWQQGRYRPVEVSSKGELKPCRLVDIEFPLAFVPSPEERDAFTLDAAAAAATDLDDQDDGDDSQDDMAQMLKEQLVPPIVWLHVIGDSNSRNFFTTLAKSLGVGPFSNAVVYDSATKNGTVAAMALRARSGDLPYGVRGREAPMPDVVVTWAWWHQHFPPSAAASQQVFESDAQQLNRLAAPTLHTFCAQFDDLAKRLGRGAFASEARRLKPYRTYVSMGSHSEELTAEGQRASLDALFPSSDDDDENARRRRLRDEIGLRLFTTTHVNSRGIPLDRFPRQDLVRNNAAVEVKNDVLRTSFLGDGSRGGEGQAGSGGGGEGERRVIDVGRMTAGLTDPDPEPSGNGRGPGWMKTYGAAHNIDAVHFVDEVYVEWSRLVVTELVVALEQRRKQAQEERYDVA